MQRDQNSPARRPASLSSVNVFIYHMSHARPSHFPTPFPSRGSLKIKLCARGRVSCHDFWPTTDDSKYIKMHTCTGEKYNIIIFYNFSIGWKMHFHLEFCKCIMSIIMGIPIGKFIWNIVHIFILFPNCIIISWQYFKYFFQCPPCFFLDTIPVSHKYLEDPSLQFRTVGSCAGLKGVKIVPQNFLTSGVVFMTVWLSDGTWTHGTGNRELGNPIHHRFHCQMITPHFVDTEVYVFLRGACRWTWKVGKVFTPT